MRRAWCSVPLWPQRGVTAACARGRDRVRPEALARLVSRLHVAIAVRHPLRVLVRRPKTVGVGGSALIAAVVVAWLSMRPVAVTVAEVGVRDVAPVIHAVGTVEAKVTVALGARIAGRITAVLVDQGDTVERGQPLVRLDDAQLALEIRRAEAAVGALAAQVRDLEAGARAEEIDEAAANVAHAEAQLEDLLAGSRLQEIEDARARLHAATATRVLAEREFARVDTLFARELVSAQDLDRSRQVAAVASAQERGAQQTLDLAMAGARPQQIESARAQVKAARDRLALLRAGSRPHQVRAVAAQLAEAQAARDLARERYADTIVRSPFDGLVISRQLEPGATVNPGTSILKLLDTRTVWVTIHVDERHTRSVTPGTPASITLRSMPGGSLAGRVVRVRRESDRVTEQLAVDVALDAPPPRLTLGEQVEAHLAPRGGARATAMPLGAVVRRPDGVGALVVRDGRVRFQPMRLGAVDAAGFVEVLAGAQAGDRVVVAPGRLAEAGRDGERVRVRRSAGTASAGEP